MQGCYVKMNKGDDKVIRIQYLKLKLQIAQFVWKCAYKYKLR